MSRFSGKMGKGALRTHREFKRDEARERQKRALLAAHPEGNCTCTAEERIPHTVKPS